LTAAVIRAQRPPCQNILENRSRLDTEHQKPTASAKIRFTEAKPKLLSSTAIRPVARVDPLPQFPVIRIRPV
jgi:hypothetical protein